MSASKVSTSREFVANFELVAKHYQLRELGEYELAKDAARRDMENAINTFSALAKEIELNCRSALTRDSRTASVSGMDDATAISSAKA